MAVGGSGVGRAQAQAQARHAQRDRGRRVQPEPPCDSTALVRPRAHTVRARTPTPPPRRAPCTALRCPLPPCPPALGDHACFQALVGMHGWVGGGWDSCISVGGWAHTRPAPTPTPTPTPTVRHEPQVVAHLVARRRLEARGSGPAHGATCRAVLHLPAIPAHSSAGATNSAQFVCARV